MADDYTLTIGELITGETIRAAREAISRRDNRVAEQAHEIERLKSDRDMWIEDDAKQNLILGQVIKERDDLRGANAEQAREIEQSTDVARVRKLMAERYGARSSCEMLQKEITDLRQEVKRLKAPWLCDCHTWPGPVEAHDYICALETVAAALRADNERFNSLYSDRLQEIVEIKAANAELITKLSDQIQQR